MGEGYGREQTPPAPSGIMAPAPADLGCRLLALGHSFGHSRRSPAQPFERNLQNCWQFRCGEVAERLKAAVC
jgi:hypothetical protein